MPRVALIHATTIAMAPVQQAMSQLWPEAEPINLLDDGLSPDLERDGKVTPAMTARFATLADYALAAGAAGILFTCSAFGEAIESVARRLPVPVLKPNEAMFSEALERGRRFIMLATFAPSVASMEAEFATMSARAERQSTLESRVVEGAMAAMRKGDEATHERLICEAAAGCEGADGVLLAHFSMARAAAAVRQAVACPVLTAPESAVIRLRRALEVPA